MSTCHSEVAGEHLGVHHVEHVMGMPVSFDIRDGLGAESRVAVDDAVAWLHEVNAIWSTHDPASVISRFARGELPSEVLPSEMHEVLDHCEQLRADTGGAFDIHVPAPNGTMLETSGYVKGWAVHKAAQILADHGIRNACVNAGGDIVILGEAHPGVAWKVGVRHPHLPHKLASVLQVRGPWAVATSAAYERGRHIVDPRTGFAAEALLSVTVVGPDLTLADVYATTLYVMGVPGLEWLLDRGDYEAMVITDDNECIMTPGFGDHL